ncbi:unnamed protein product, partial [Cyprideis torosa]
MMTSEELKPQMPEVYRLTYIPKQIQTNTYHFTPLSYGVGYSAPQSYAASSFKKTSSEYQAPASEKVQYQATNQVDDEQAKYQALEAHKKVVEEHQKAYEAALQNHYAAIEKAKSRIQSASYKASSSSSASASQEQGSSSASYKQQYSVTPVQTFTQDVPKQQYRPVIQVYKAVPAPVK